MTESGEWEHGTRGEPGQPSVSPEVDPLDAVGPNALASAEAFQTLANEVRVAVLVALRAAERADDEPLSFSELQRAAGADSSAGFAYHLRQLSGHFVRQEEGGYVLTPAGRGAAETIAAGTFTDAGSRNQAS